MSSSFAALEREGTGYGLLKHKVESTVAGPVFEKPISYVQFNEKIGLPYSRITDKRSPMTSYQIKYSDMINKHHRVIVNKTKKGGFTDGFLRHVAHQIFYRYAGHEVMLVAGNKEPIARDIMSRLYDLFENGLTDDDKVHWEQEQLILSFTKSPLVMKFYNGTTIIGSTASKSGRSSSFRGYSDVCCWFITEAAFTGVIDDYPILNGLTSLTANRNDGDMILESTPNGKNGFFHDLSMDASDNLKKKNAVGSNGYYYMEIDYTAAVDEGVIAPSFIEEEKKNTRIDFAQEYCCAFTNTASNAISLDDDYFPESVSSINLSKDMKGELEGILV